MGHRGNNVQILVNSMVTKVISAMELCAGTKATMAVYNAAVFGLLPLCAEVPLVCAAVSRVSSPTIGVAVALVSLLYIAFTVCMTEARTVAGLDSMACRAQERLLGCHPE